MEKKKRIDIEFLGENLSMDHNPDVILVLWILEIMETKFSEGSFWLNVLKTKYKSSFSDKDLLTKVENILTSSQ